MQANNPTATPPPLDAAGTAARLSAEQITEISTRLARRLLAQKASGKRSVFASRGPKPTKQHDSDIADLLAALDAQAAEVAGLRAEREERDGQLAEIVERWENSGPDMMPHDTDEMFARRLVLHEEYFILLRAELGLPTEGAARA